MTARRHRCTWCGEFSHVMERHLDAADCVHWFHPKCWRASLRWLAGLKELFR